MLLPVVYQAISTGKDISNSKLSHPPTPYNKSFRCNFQVADCVFPLFYLSLYIVGCSAVYLKNPGKSPDVLSCKFDAKIC